MKKILLLAFTAILFTSCKKEYVCFCGDEKMDIGGVVIYDTKKNAEKKCAEKETFYINQEASPNPNMRCGLSPD